MKSFKSIYTCPRCNKVQGRVGVIQKEINYYYLIVETGQLEDFHGDGTMTSRNYFCINCQVKINDKVITKIIE